MAYTNVWTTAAPLDTQAANQGAVDFRATKLDVMQRISSFGAGLLANRPTPEATSASADWTGVTYLATDTNQLFRWNGSSWDNISTSVPNSTSKFVNSTLSANTNPAAGDYGSVSSGANLLYVGAVIEAFFAGTFNVSPPSGGAITLWPHITSASGGNLTETFPNLPNDGNTYVYSIMHRGVVTSTTAIDFNTVFNATQTTLTTGITTCYQAAVVITLADALTLALTTNGFTGQLNCHSSYIKIR